MLLKTYIEALEQIAFGPSIAKFKAKFTNEELEQKLVDVYKKWLANGEDIRAMYQTAKAANINDFVKFITSEEPLDNLQGCQALVKVKNPALLMKHASKDHAEDLANLEISYIEDLIDSIRAQEDKYSDVAKLDQELGSVDLSKQNTQDKLLPAAAEPSHKEIQLQNDFSSIDVEQSVNLVPAAATLFTDELP